jgi:hypothetical protein
LLHKREEPGNEVDATVYELTSSFTLQLAQAIDRIFPPRTMTRHITDKPWITPEIKNLIKDCLKPFHSNNTPLAITEK